MPLPPSVENLLKQSETGQAALKYFNDNKLDLETKTEGAIAYFDPGDGAARKKKMVLNTSKPAAMVAAYFCHEMYHAKMNITGNTGDAKKDTQDDYVEKMVQEEADGTAIGFRCYYELEKKGLATGTAPDRYDFYKRAVEAGQKSAGTADPDAAGFTKGTKMARALINDRFLGPNAIQSYSEYYKRDWVLQNRN
ncbi:MAG: DUF6782 family putative metallopeptidase [Gemmataceae bacterium]